MSISIIKNREDLFPVSPEAVPYVLVCNRHGDTHPCQTRAEAKDLANWSSEWCDDCFNEEAYGLEIN
jgi:hypothetical protein